MYNVSCMLIITAMVKNSFKGLMLSKCNGFWEGEKLLYACWHISLLGGEVLQAVGNSGVSSMHRPHGDWVIWSLMLDT